MALLLRRPSADPRPALAGSWDRPRGSRPSDPDRWNRALDALLRRARGHGLGPDRAFRVCGVAGFLTGAALSLGLAWYRSLALGVIAAAIAAALAASFGVAMVTKVLLGEERWTFYHHLLTVLAVGAAVPWLFGRPVVPHLEVLVLGFAALHVPGKLGCFLAGCCHGRPCRIGVVYGEDHARAGFPPQLAGARLFPVQLAEGAWLLLLVVGGVALIWRGAPPGEALALFLLGYPIGRFFFELARGVEPRRRLLGLVEAQWISLLVVAGVAAAGLAGLLPLRGAHLVAAGGFLVVALAVAAGSSRSSSPRSRLLAPSHVHEVAGALDRLDPGRLAVLEPPRRSPGGVRDPARIRLETTSLGVQLSAGEVAAGGERLRHYSFSRRGEELGAREAGILAELILRLRHPSAPSRLVAGDRSVFHLLVAAGTNGATS
jgi:prolipoprotein diacylglyceryltransferase